MMNFLEIVNALFGLGCKIFAIVFVLWLCLILLGDDKKRKTNVKTMLKLELESVIKFILVFVFLLLISETCFNIDIIKIVVKCKFDKIIIGTIIWYFICDAKKIHFFIREDDLLREIEKNSFLNSPVKEIEYWKIQEEQGCEILSRKLDILIKLAPISLLSTFLGYFLQNIDQVSINWNIYTVVIMSVLGIYMYMIFDTFSRVKRKKNTIRKMEQKVIEIQNKKEESNRLRFKEI